MLSFLTPFLQDKKLYMTRVNFNIEFLCNGLFDIPQS